MIYRITREIARLSQHRFSRDVAILQVGSAGGTFMQVITGIILARWLQPDMFGVYTLAFGLASIGALLLGAGFQDATASALSAAYVQKDREEIARVFGFFVKMMLYVSVATMLIIVSLPSVADMLYENKSIGLYAGIIVLGVMCSSSFFALSSLGLQAIGHIRSLTILIFLDQLLRYGACILFVGLGLGVFGASSGHLIGACAAAIVSLFFWRWLRANYSLFPSLRSLIRNVRSISIRRYFHFGAWVAIDRNIANLFMILPVVLTGIYVAAAEVTYFKLAFGLVNLGLTLLGPISVLLNMEFPKMRLESTDKLASQFTRISLYGMGLSTVLVLLTWAVAPLAFRITYGVSYLPGVPLVSGLVLYGALYGIGVGLGPMWRAVDRVKVSVLINVVTLGVGIPLGIVLLRSFQLWGAVTMVTLWFSISHVVSFLYLRHYLKAKS